MLSALSATAASPLAASGSPGAARADGAASTNTRSNEERIAQLKETDRKVRAHEAAHLAAAGGLAIGGASFTYTRGPDGQAYATGGEVSISLREGRKPDETLAIAERISRAALAPTDPSGQDRSVAARAAAMASQARVEMLQEQLRAYRGETASPGSRLDALA